METGLAPTKTPRRKSLVDTPAWNRDAVGSIPTVWTMKVHHVEGCTCNLSLINEVIDKVVDRKAPYLVDAEGNPLVYVDSFGFRGKFPGESDICNKEYIRRMTLGPCMDCCDVGLDDGCGKQKCRDEWDLSPSG